MAKCPFKMIDKNSIIEYMLHVMLLYDCTPLVSKLHFKSLVKLVQ